METLITSFLFFFTSFHLQKPSRMTLIDKILCRPCIFCGIIDGTVRGNLIYKACLP